MYFSVVSLPKVKKIKCTILIYFLSKNPSIWFVRNSIWYGSIGSISILYLIALFCSNSFSFGYTKNIYCEDERLIWLILTTSKSMSNVEKRIRIYKRNIYIKHMYILKMKFWKVNTNTNFPNKKQP